MVRAMNTGPNNPPLSACWSTLFTIHPGRTISKAPKKLAAIESRYTDAQISKMDGISVDYPDWHFNVRASNTEPLLRLNVEAATPEMMEKKRDEVLSMIRG